MEKGKILSFKGPIVEIFLKQEMYGNRRKLFRKGNVLKDKYILF